MINFKFNKTDASKPKNSQGVGFPAKAEGESDMLFKSRREAYFGFFMHPVTDYVHKSFCSMSKEKRDKMQELDEEIYNGFVTSCSNQSSGLAY